MEEVVVSTLAGHGHKYAMAAGERRPLLPQQNDDLTLQEDVMHLEWSGIGCDVPAGSGARTALCCPWSSSSSSAEHGASKQTKTILQDVSGSVSVGHMLMILGPSGSGKTSLLDMLSGRKTVGHLRGTIHINGRSVSMRDMRTLAGYVPQSDVLLPTLTVRETLAFAVELRVPAVEREHPTHEIVERMLSDLNLSKVADCRVGDDTIRGISGGEKRRVSIGIELIVSPKIMFLDEPTSGLDSYAALEVIKLLQSYAEARQALFVSTIHQPSSAIYAIFKDVLLLAAGQVVFRGPRSSVDSWLKKADVECPRGWNEADWLLHIVSQEGADDGLLSGGSREERHRHLARCAPQSESGNLLASGDGGINNTQDTAAGVFRTRRQPGFWRKVAVLIRRNLLHTVRHPAGLVQQVFQYLLSAVFTGLLFSKLKENREEQLTLGMNFGLDCFSVFSFFCVPLYIQSRTIFNRERAAGFYSPGPYFVANALTQLPTSVIICFLYTYILSALQHWHGNLWFYFLVNNFVMQIFMAVNEFIGASISNLDVALGVAGMVNVFSMVFCGVCSYYPNIPIYLKWVYWGTPMSYAMSAVMDNEFTGTPRGEAFLDVYGSPLIGYKYQIVAILAGYLVLTRLSCYLALRFLQKEKR
eukprot:m.78949 g.78949  ORF g.78949 m.78949 type:complete len:642 (-) comp8173_c0_seq8:80-2005(-)